MDSGAPRLQKELQLHQSGQVMAIQKVKQLGALKFLITHTLYAMLLRYCSEPTPRRRLARVLVP